LSRNHAVAILLTENKKALHRITDESAIALPKAASPSQNYLRNDDARSFIPKSPRNLSILYERRNRLPVSESSSAQNFGSRREEVLNRS
jgi:hypothetical protein